MDVVSPEKLFKTEVLALIPEIMGEGYQNWTLRDLLEKLADPEVEHKLARVQFGRRLEHAAAVAGKLGHDFGNILTGILGFAELSLKELPLESAGRRYVQEIVDSAQNGAAWNRKLQDFCRKPSGQGQATFLAPMVAEEGDRLRRVWGNRVTLVIALPGDLAPAAIDAVSMRQLIRQLLDNAFEAVTDRGVVTLSARTVEVREPVCWEIDCAKAGSHVEITITDTGAGLNDETRQRLFRELFFSTKARRRGLGLAVVYGILQGCQGSLCFEPDSRQGTTVRVLLPVASLPAPKPAGRILIVDDDPAVLGMVCQVLAKAGYQVHGAAGPDEAIALCQAATEPFRLIVSDIVMPHMNGFEMVRRLQTQGIAVNVLFISSQPNNGLAADGLLDQYPLLMKPFELNELVQAAAAALARSPAPVGGKSNHHVFQ